ncbi:Heterokaryon incompatibility protein 6 [Colletotrichum gloeosporioides]|uniref:Heterokaryon incompatibility protein 6 n=1 Tax=Colletotrichum gloeosporioides TaxID=474922 RepID=A0A8H4FG25_COLGL|nr:Heterokaryon incompatibility protein 6 [Colletotrichum gloeosporioides]KAF3800705.1 Heterokaryon incompatibility protein 6 [Colletotrichum gloeosporioides]
MATSESFTYPSALGASQFRLVNIQAAREGPLETQVATFSLAAHPKYYTLSYCWGAADFDSDEADQAPRFSSIAVDGRTFPVRENLRDALLQLRQSFPDAWFWIDAICINQNDNAERSAQVAIMDKIYTKSYSTVAWIGREKPGLERALEVIIDRLMTWDKWLDAPGINYWEVNATQDYEPLARAMAGIPDLALEDWMALESIYGRRWFWRLWVVQEVALSTEVIVLCGNQQIPWPALGMFAWLTMNSGSLYRGQQLMGENGLHRQVDMGIMNATAINTCRSWCDYYRDLYSRDPSNPIRPGVSTPDGNITIVLFPKWEKALEDLLDNTSTFESTDGRDQIYGLLGMLKFIAELEKILAEFERQRDDFVDFGFDDALISVDYDIPLSDLYTRVTSQIVESGRLELLSRAGVAYGRVEGLPSWVPDFRGSNVTDLVQDASRHAGNANLGIRIVGDKLYCRGFKVGAVPESTDFLAQALSGLANPVYPFTNRPTVDAFWRTLVMDKKEPVSRLLGASDEVGLSFREWTVSCMLQVAVAQLQAGMNWDAVQESLKDFDETAAMDTTGLYPGTKDLKARLGILGFLEEAEEASEEEKRAVIERAQEHLRIWQIRSLHTNRLFTLLDGGHMAQLDNSAALGDEVWILQGLQLPLQMRRVEGGNWIIVRDAYVHGIMSGEAITDEVVWEDICIV